MPRGDGIVQKAEDLEQVEEEEPVHQKREIRLNTHFF